MKLVSVESLSGNPLLPNAILETLIDYFPKGYSFSLFSKRLITPPSLSSVRVNSALLLSENKGKDFVLETFPNRWKVEQDNLLEDCYTIPLVQSELYHQEMNEQFIKKYNYKFVVVDYRCANSILRGAPIFAAGVIASSKSLCKHDSVLIVCDWNSQCTRGEKIDVNDNSWSQLCAFKEDNPFIFLGIGEVIMERSEIYQQHTKGIAVEVKIPIFDTVQLHSLPKYLFAQNVSSIFIAHLMEVRFDSTILDCCAAPGGKSGHLLNNLLKEIIINAKAEGKDFKEAISQSKSRILALDRQKSKVEDMKNSLWNQFDSLLQYNPKILECKALDSSKLHVHFQPNTFDRILCDVPCTGTGLRPNLQPPSLHPCQTLEALQLQASYQFRIVKEAIPLLKSGGILVYSTCSITAQENEMQVKKILEEFGNKLELMDLPSHLRQNPKYFTTGLTSVLPEHDAIKCLRFDFVECDQTIGFFACRFRAK